MLGVGYSLPCLRPYGQYFLEQGASNIIDNCGTPAFIGFLYNIHDVVRIPFVYIMRHSRGLLKCQKSMCKLDEGYLIVRI